MNNITSPSNNFVPPAFLQRWGHHAHVVPALHRLIFGFAEPYCCTHVVHEVLLVEGFEGGQSRLWGSRLILLYSSYLKWPRRLA
jgi:hypothetical protein